MKATRWWANPVLCARKLVSGHIRRHFVSIDVFIYVFMCVCPGFEVYGVDMEWVKSRRFEVH